MKLLSTDEMEDLCFISNSSGICNKANFIGIVFFEQRMLITAENLEYLWNH